MSKCVLCGRELLTGDVHWEQGLCNECYNKTKNSDPYFDVVVDKRKIQIREKYIEDLEKQLSEKDKEIECIRELLEAYKKQCHIFLDNELQIRKQVCDEIREKCIYTAGTKQICPNTSISTYNLNEILDQIEKGEIK